MKKPRMTREMRIHLTSSVGLLCLVVGPGLWFGWGAAITLCGLILFVAAILSWKGIL